MSGNGDRLDHLRIPFEKIKFGHKLEVQGYGTVYQGEYDNQRVALKQLNITNLANIKRKLLDEILTISRFRQHPNLVALLGFCDDKSNEIILVYEYVASGNLADKMRKRLSTIQRLEICLDAAHGLNYLHTGVDKSTTGIIHGNIKPSKILLNLKSNSSRFEAKVSSFGLSKIVPGKSQKNLEAMNTDDDATKESDVYSFGVMLLEVLCGVSELVDTDDFLERHVTELVPKKMEQNKLRKIVHHDMKKDMTTESLETYAKIACQCVIEKPEERPTMGQVVEELEKALRLQGGEVSYVDIPTIREDLITDDKIDVAGEDTTGDKINIVGTTSVSTNRNGVNNTPQIPTTEEQIYHVPVMASSDGDNVIEKTHIEDAQKETVMMGTNDPETLEETANNSNSDNESNIAGKKKQTAKLATTSKFSNGNTSTSDPQGGDVTDVQVLGGSNGNGVSEGAINMDDHVDDNGETMSLDMAEEQSEVKIVSNEDTIDKIAVEERSYNVPILDSLVDGESLDSVDDGESLPAETHLQDAEEEIINNVSMSTNDPETTKQVTGDLKSNAKSNSTEENMDDNHNTKPDTFIESRNGDTNPPDNSTEQEVQNSGVPKSGIRNFDNLPYKNHDEETGDELEHLRIPFDKIKFGKKINLRGYGSLFEGEFDLQQVALKRLNITNLANIKPKLLAEILKVAKFRQHPNLVALIGFSDEKSNEIILVYEYVSSGNLADKMSKHLTAIQRLEICLGAARGLDYLHTGVDSATPGIIHGDIRLSKILLNLDSSSSKFEAKVSGFGLPKLLPGDVQIARRSMDPVYQVTGKLTKESDVYTFGVLLLEVLCGVPELIDTDDYQERHVTEIVPKRLKQNMLRKIVHFDIREEITTKSLETYAEIASRCVLQNPNERPTMAEVVIELEKALRLQGGELPDVHILGSSTANGLHEETVDKSDQQESKLTEETTKDVAIQDQSFPAPLLSSEEGEIVPNITGSEDAKKENGESTNDPEETQEIPVDPKANEESEIIVENEDDNESNIMITTSYSNNGDNDTSDMQGQSVDERVNVEDATKDNTDDPDSNEILDDNITATEITMVQEMQNPLILDSDNANDGKHSVLLKAQKTPDFTVNIRDAEFSDLADDDKLLSNQDFGSKRSNSTCSESSNGDDSTPSDYLIKSPANGTTTKKTLYGSGNCCCCSWWCYLFDRVVFYGGQFWNNLVSCFNGIIGHCSSKHD